MSPSAQFQPMGMSYHRSVCHTTKHLFPSILFQSRSGAWLVGRHYPYHMECTAALCLPSIFFPILGTSQNIGGPSSHHSYSSNMATTGLVYIPPSYDSMSTNLSPSNATAPFTGCILHHYPEMLHLKAWLLLWFQDSEITCFDAVKQIFLNYRHDMTRHTYIHKWNRFQCCVPPIRLT